MKPSRWNKHCRRWQRPAILRPISALIVALAWFTWISTPVVQGQESVVYRNFVRHSDGSFCTDLPPEASFVAFLNGDRSQLLTETAPRWEEGAVPNIDGKGTFGLELGNFDSLRVGHRVTVEFFCLARGETGTLTDSIPAIPWLRFPRTLTLSKTAFPGPVADLSLRLGSSEERVLTWGDRRGDRVYIYRRDLGDTVRCGLERMLYRLVGVAPDSGLFVDTTRSTFGHGYLAIRERGGTWGPHSAEVVDYPPAPTGLTCTAVGEDCLRVVLTWQYPGRDSVGFRVYRADTDRCTWGPETLLANVSDTFWIDRSVAEGQTWYYRVAAVNSSGIVGPLSETVGVTVQPSPRSLADLDVLYISRTPRYPRYQVAYDPPGYNPHESPETEGVKHYPDVGEPVMYTATIRNNGGRTVQHFTVVWEVDSAEVKREQLGPLVTRQVVRSSIVLPWNDQPQRIRCRVLPEEGVRELTPNNNAVEIRTNALAFHFHIERSSQAVFDSTQGPLGSFGFEDWAQFEIAQMLRFFRQARYPKVTPDGLPESVFLDTVSVVDDGALPAWGTHAPESPLWDGHWGFTSDPNTIRYFRDEVLGKNNGVDWALLHELGHQLGLIDLYRMDVSRSQLQVVEPRTGRRPEIHPIAWDVLYYCSRKDHLMHSNFQAGFSDHSAGALKRNAGRRRGFYGDYLADIPSENGVVVLDETGRTVAGAQIWVYQKQDDIIPNVQKFSGFTDSTGLFWFPHRTDSTYAGGIWVRHPFSSTFSQNPHVVGTNATLFFRVAKGDSVGYAFMDICPFNVAYWSGKHDSATYRLVVKQWQYLPVSGVEQIRHTTPARPGVTLRPNPFNLQTTIRFYLSSRQRISLRIFDVRGRVIRQLEDGVLGPGLVETRWDGRDANARPVSSGVYFCVLNAAGRRFATKMLLIR